MLSILTTFLATACDALRPQADLLLENAALQQQLGVLCRQAKGPGYGASTVSSGSGSLADGLRDRNPNS